MTKECKCEDFKIACKMGSNHGGGWLFGYDPVVKEWDVGENLREPKYCPWCGGRLPKPEDIER